MQRPLLATPLPTGMRYEEDFLTPDYESALLEDVTALSFATVKMHGVEARRHVAHFGLGYDYNSGASKPGRPMPAYLLDLRDRVGDWLGRDPDELVEALVTEYPVNAGIGWHRDAPQFGIVAGVSLLSSCRFKLRPMGED